MLNWLWKFFAPPPLDEALREETTPRDRVNIDYTETIDGDRVEYTVMIDGKPVEGEEAERISRIVHQHADGVFEHADRALQALDKMFDDLGNEPMKDKP